MLLDFSKYVYPEKHCKPENYYDNQVLQMLQKIRVQNDIAVTTSGSTGRPKEVKHKKSAMISSALMTGEYFQWKQGDSALLCLPINKIAGIMMLMRAFVWKLRLFCLPPKLQLKLSNIPRLNFAAMIPIQATENFSDLQRIDNLLLGGAAIHNKLKNKLIKLPNKSVLSYGMTETISHIAMQKIDRNSDYFKLLPNVEIDIDKYNCLQITAPQLGVYKLQTNDIVEIIDSKTFRFIGRKDNIINSGGLKILVESIEQQISNIISEDFYIKSTTHESLGEQVTLFIEGDKWNKDKIQILKRSLKNINPKQAIPKKIIFQPHLNRTSSGKLRRND